MPGRLLLLLFITILHVALMLTPPYNLPTEPYSCLPDSLDHLLVDEREIEGSWRTSLLASFSFLRTQAQSGRLRYVLQEHHQQTVVNNKMVLSTAVRLAASRPSGRTSSIKFLGKDGWAARLSAPVPTAVAAAAAVNTVAASSAATTPVASPIEINVVPETVTTVPPSMYEDTPASNMRKIIARRLTESKATVPHSYTSIEITGRLGGFVLIPIIRYTD